MDFLFQVLFSLRETFKAGIIVTPELKQKLLSKLKISEDGLNLYKNYFVKCALISAHLEKYAFEIVHTKLCALNHKIIRIKKCAQKYALKIVRTKLCALNHMRLNALNSCALIILILDICALILCALFFLALILCALI